MTQVRIQKLWRGHMTRWTTHHKFPLILQHCCCCCCVETTLFPLILQHCCREKWKPWARLSFENQEKSSTEERGGVDLHRNGEQNISRTDINPMTMTNDKNEYQPDVVRFFSKTEHVEQNISRIDINPMTMTNGKNEYQPDVVRFLKFNQIEFCSDASSRVLDCLSKQAWADLRISTGTPGGWRIWDSINQIKQLVWSNVHNFEQSFWSLFVQVEYEAEYERALVEVKEELREKEVNERTIGNFTFEIILRQFHI